MALSSKRAMAAAAIPTGHPGPGPPGVLYVVLAHGDTVDQFIGDTVLAVFGSPVVGHIGCPKHMGVTVIGETVNRAARLESFTRQPGLAVRFDRATPEWVAACTAAADSAEGDGGRGGSAQGAWGAARVDGSGCLD